jgi:hypothetical protein
MKRLRIIIFFVILPATSILDLSAQPLNSIYDNKELVSFEKYIYSADSVFHTSIRPFLVSDLKKALNYNKVWYSYLKATGDRQPATGKTDSLPLSPSPHPPFSLLNLVFNTNLISVTKKDYGFTIDPMFDFGYGYDFANDRSSWVNTRGFLVEGYLGKTFAFSSRFYESQSKVPLWIDKYISLRNVMPGQGRVKPFGIDAWDYGVASGYISWSPGKFFNFQFGQGKQFFGDGYRSLILSDFSSSHPYFMITTTFWKIKYVNLYSQFSHPDVIANNSGGDPVFSKKYSTMHYLSFAPTKKWNISLFEAIVWQAYDSSFTRGFDISYLNPVIFYRPVEYNLGDGDNALIGANLRFSPTKTIALYGQLLIDEFKIKEMTSGKGWSGNKYAWQLGAMGFDVFGISNLSLQAEFNLIRPYTYSHYSLVQNYSNNKEPLAHPDGANARETVVIAKYNSGRLYFNLKYVWEGTGLDSAGIDYGKNIFRSPIDAPNEYGNKTGQGLYTKLNQLDLSVSYLVNPSTDMNLFVGYIYRTEKNRIMNNAYSYINFGFRTSLRNLYSDFF